MVRSILILFLAIGGLQGEFVAPSEVAPVIHREQVPLDVDRMSELASDLVSLAARAAVDAEADPSGGAARWRASAQLIVLAERLDAASGKTRRLRKMLVKGEDPSRLAGDGSKESLRILPAALTFMVGQSKKGEEQPFLQYLLDPLAIVLPGEESLSHRQAEGEEERWAGIVPPVAAYQPIPKETPANELASREEEVMEQEEEPVTEEENARIEPFTGGLIFPAFLSYETAEGGTETRAKLANLSLTLQSGTGNKPEIEVPDQKGKQVLKDGTKVMLTAMKRRHQEALVNSLKGQLAFEGGGGYLSRNQKNHLLPLAALTEAALTNAAVRPDTLVLGHLQPDGSLIAPVSPWQFVEMLLRKQEGAPKRIVASRELLPYFRSLLTMHEEGFFMENDVFLVERFDEALPYLLEGSDKDETIEALAQMAEIRRVGEEKRVSVFVANSHVLARLDALQELEPNYLSPRMLALRGHNKQPLQLSPEVLASQLEFCIQPMAGLPDQKARDVGRSLLEDTHEKCRAAIDPLAKYVALNERDLYEETLALINRLRTAARARGRLGEEEWHNSEMFDSSSYAKTFASMKEEYTLVRLKLAARTGSSVPSEVSQ